jgi:hypothetical protein
VVFLSKFLDPFTSGWSEYIQAVAATFLLTEEIRKITFGGNLITITPHQVRTILNLKVGRWLMDSKILKYVAILLEKDDLTVTTDEALNPATFLEGEAGRRSPRHKCLHITEYQTKVRPDWGNAFPFLGSISLWVDSLG